MMEYRVDVRKLSAMFYQAYPNAEYPEILQKGDRPYTCLLIDMREYFICVPFRSEMKHQQGFVFSGTRRSQRSCSGLDYKKLVLLRDTSYIDDSPAVVDADEYHAVISNLDKIITDVLAYIDGYTKHILEKSNFFLDLKNVPKSSNSREQLPGIKASSQKSFCCTSFMLLK